MHRRWSYRTRLAALIAGVFVLGGATLLGAQMVIVRNLLDDGVVATAANIEGWLVQREPGTSAGIQGSAECEPGQALRVVQDAIECVEVHDDPAGPLASDGLELRVDVQQYASFSMTELTRLSDGVLAALVPWSVAILSGFAGIAALAAHWLSRRSLGRVKAITAATRTITRDRIDQRLALAGPADEISELGETIDGMLDRLQDSFERQDRFVAGASHELHTPLATTRTLLEIPLHQGRFPAGVQAAVRGALAANARAERLIDVLLTLTRTKAASGAPRPSPPRSPYWPRPPRRPWPSARMPSPSAASRCGGCPRRSPRRRPAVRRTASWHRTDRRRPPHRRAAHRGPHPRAPRRRTPPSRDCLSSRWATWSRTRSGTTATPVPSRCGPAPAPAPPGSKSATTGPISPPPTWRG